MNWERHREVEYLFSARREILERFAAVDLSAVDIYIRGCSSRDEMSGEEVLALEDLARQSLQRQLGQIDAKLAACGVSVEGGDDA